MPEPTKPTRLDDTEVLIFETSPYGTLDAIVEHDGLAVYFYLNQPQENGKFGTRACWVRNLQIGPMVINADEMQQGIPPQLPRTHCVNREGQPLPNPDNLSIVWLEEGNGAALIETVNGETKTLAVIPPWSGLDGFYGYAAECATECEICWPMPDNPNLDLRVNQAREFWASAANPESENSFSRLQPSLLEYYESRFTSGEKTDTKATEYFSIDGGKFPPRGLVKLNSGNETTLVTVGLSYCPQPAVELFNDNPAKHRRIELGLHLRNYTQTQAQSAMNRISSLAAYPWRNFTWLGDGHTCELKNIFTGCEHALLVHDAAVSGTGEASEIPAFRNDPINLLWLIPITPEQLSRLKEEPNYSEQIAKAYATDHSC